MTASTVNLLSVIGEFQKLDKEMQAQTMQIFLIVANNEGITMKEIEQRTGYGPSSVSRNITLLGEINRRGQPGHNLVISKTDPADARVKRVYLTAKGKRTVDAVTRRLNGDFT